MTIPSVCACKVEFMQRCNCNCVCTDRHAVEGTCIWIDWFVVRELGKCRWTYVSVRVCMCIRLWCDWLYMYVQGRRVCMIMHK